jgi:(p)ppGpp synthase/HD superfamily hydrolase
MDLSLRFGKAIQFVLDAHKGHLRKGTEIPYVSHLLAVASIVLDYGGGEDEAIAALLHDVVEDRGVEVGEIRKQFGNKAAEIVAACSDSFEKNPENKPDWRVRKEAYLKHLKMAASDVLLVSAADKLHNVRSIVKDFREIGNKVWERFNGGKDGTLWYYTSLVKTLRASGEHKMLVEEFARCVSTLEGIISSTQSNQL